MLPASCVPCLLRIHIAFSTIKTSSTPKSETRFGEVKARLIKSATAAARIRLQGGQGFGPWGDAVGGAADAAGELSSR
jgi:hypothetical protein